MTVFLKFTSLFLKLHVQSTRLFPSATMTTDPTAYTASTATLSGLASTGTLSGTPSDPVRVGFNGDPVRDAFRGDPVRVGFNGDSVRDAFSGDPVRVGFHGDPVRDAFYGDPVRDGFLGDPVRHSFLRCDCSDLSRCLLLGEMTFSAHSRLRWSTPDGWPDSRTWHRIRPPTYIRHYSLHTARLWRRSSRNWCCRSCRRRCCWRGHSRRRQNTSRRRPHTASCLRSFFGCKVPLYGIKSHRKRKCSCNDQVNI